MDEAGKEAVVAAFIGISGTTPEKANFFLQSSQWDLHTALATFFDSNIDSPPPSSSGTATATAGAGAAAVADDDSSSEEEGQAFYAGGANSGQQVIGPSKKKKDLVAKIFKSAKEHGAESLEVQGISTKPKKGAFRGTGYRLGETESDHEVVAGPSKTGENHPQEVVLKMWSTGFTVDDGPFQSYEDPANRMFLKSVMKGQVPRELLKNVKSGSVFINMEDHKEEDYVPPRNSLTAFTGQGHSLGSPTPSVITTPTEASAASLPSANPIDLEKAAREALGLNENEPTTNIQLRFPDGSRTVLKLNHTHTVGQVRQFILSSRPALGLNIAIMTTFPYAEMNNDLTTITSGNLLNSSLVVKVK